MASVETLFEAFAREHFKHHDVVLKAMPGGASTRKYYRTLAGKNRAVIMYVPDLTPEEATHATNDKAASWPFLEVHRYLEEHHIRVPKVLSDERERGFVLLEDLGDDTLAEVLLRSPHRKAALYRQAVLDLARAQRTLWNPPALVSGRRFDTSLLRWELEHFREYGIDARGLRLSPSALAEFARIADALAQRISEFPKSFVHRDYQSRNLMVLGNETQSELAWIDFQDALIGPKVYDLVALLRDSYQTFDEAFIDDRIREFATASDLHDVAELRRQFDLMTVQRKLKDAGRFVFLEQVKGKAGFMPFVEPTLHLVQETLARLKGDTDMVRLSDVLEPVLSRSGPEGK